MPEREFINDYDAWLQQQPWEPTSEPEDPEDYYSAPPDPYVPEADPNAWLYDANNRPSMPYPQAGWDWVWNGKQWTGQRIATNEPTPTAAPPEGPTGPTGPPQPRRTLSSLNLPAFNPPSFSAPTPFSYADFKAPSMEEAQKEPGFDYALKLGLKAMENSKAYLGTYRTGGTIKGLNDYARNMASQNYSQVYSRSADTYDRNRNNAADTYATNYGVSRDVFDRNYTGYKDSHSSRSREAELNFQRDWDQYAYENDDAYRRWKAMVDANDD